MTKEKFKANIREAIRSLYAFKQRSILTLIGIVIGISSIIAMISVSIIVKEETIRQLKEMGTDIFTVQKGSAEIGQLKNREKRIILEDVAAMPLRCQLITKTVPIVTNYAEIKYKANKFGNPIIGTSQALKELDNIKLKEGRFISDLDANSFFCVIGSQTANKLKQFGFKEMIGGKIKFADNILPLSA